MEWERLGHLFVANEQHDWMVSHAANPIAKQLSGNQYRIFFNCRDRNNRSSIACFDWDITQPTQYANLSEQPVLSPGEPGHFDDNGVSIGCILPVNNQFYLYYLGWTLCKHVPFHNTIGIAVADSIDLNFQRMSPAPIMGRHSVDPITLSYPCVRYNGDKFSMWYGSHLTWQNKHNTMEHVIKYASSADGISWQRSGQVCIAANDTDYAFSRPCVLQFNNQYHMWYNYRGEDYKIGYAISNDGIHWQRQDEKMNFLPSNADWDQASQAYPFVFAHENDLYMLYCGNNYGRTGFGVAKLPHFITDL